MLNAPARVIFVVRGPAPTCDVAGRFRVRADRGVNHVRFTGRVGRRNLPYGTYRITARTPGRAPSRPVTVTVGAGTSPSSFACASAAPDLFTAITATFSNGSTDGSAFASTGGTGGTAASQPGDSGTAASGDGVAAKPKRDRGVLPAVSDKLREIPGALPSPKMPSAAGSPPWIVGALALLLLALSAIALVVYVVRFMRRPHTT